jgi:hypothetical protein
MVKSTSLGKEKAKKKKKHLDQSSLMKWNSLTQKLTILAIRIVDNDKFLSLRWNPASLSLI